MFNYKINFRNWLLCGSSTPFFYYLYSWITGAAILIGVVATIVVIQKLVQHYQKKTPLRLTRPLYVLGLTIIHIATIALVRLPGNVINAEFIYYPAYILPTAFIVLLTALIPKINQAIFGKLIWRIVAGIIAAFFLVGAIYALKTNAQDIEFRNSGYKVMLLGGCDAQWL